MPNTEYQVPEDFELGIPHSAFGIDTPRLFKRHSCIPALT
jgi:hypothetical protein